MEIEATAHKKLLTRCKSPKFRYDVEAIGYRLKFEDVVEGDFDTKHFVRFSVYMPLLLQKETTTLPNVYQRKLNHRHKVRGNLIELANDTASVNVPPCFPSSCISRFIQAVQQPRMDILR